MHEREFIEWIRSQGKPDPLAVLVGPGDDCAVVDCGGQRALLTTDQVLDGIHFALADCGPAAAGRKAMARCLSDIAAMAGEPVATVASVSLPKGFARRDAEAIYTGMREMADRFDCPIVGGDVATWPGALAISVTAVGRAGGKDGSIEPILRSGAKVGEAVCVTGQLGGAWRDGRDLGFVPRISEAIVLAEGYEISSMIDISDGLAADMHQICRASGVAAQIIATDIPVHSGADPAAALGDGEDYELLFTLPAGQAARLCADQPLPVKVSRIGEVVEGHGVTLIGADGQAEPLAPLGWEHETNEDR